MATVHTLEPTVLSITAGTTAVQVAGSSQGIRVTSFSVQNQSTSTVYIGGSAVAATAGSGFQITAGSTLEFDREKLRTAAETYDPSNYWVITAATGATLVCLFNSVVTRS